MIIKAAIKEYEVLFENDLSFLSDLTVEDNAFYVIDRNVWDLYQDHFSNINNNSLYLLDATEENKIIETALAICEAMVSMNAKRNACLISLGGGITQDITGFVANILYRGIAWTFVPTTLLAACDSCIGGKTSLNYKSYKNLLGTFYPPDRLYICPEFFRTLSDNDLKSGLGEVVKFNVMRGKEALPVLESSIQYLINLDPETINSFVKNSLEFKKDIIEEDEFDTGKRVLLNFAHTFGHAFEVSSNYTIPHGSAVALGMIAANSVSVKRSLLDSQKAKRIESLVDQILPPFSGKLIDPEVVIKAIRKDKKQIGKNMTAVLLCADDKLVVVNDMTEQEVADACTYASAFLQNRFA